MPNLIEWKLTRVKRDDDLFNRKRRKDNSRKGQQQVAKGGRVNEKTIILKKPKGVDCTPIVICSIQDKGKTVKLVLKYMWSAKVRVK